MELLADYRYIDLEDFVEEFGGSYDLETVEGMEILGNLFDTHLIYYSQISKEWDGCGHPNPEDMGAYETIFDAMTSAVIEWCCEEIAPVFDGLIEEWREAQEEE